MGAVGVSPVYAGREVAPTCITLHFHSFLISESCRIHGKKIFDFWILASAIPPKQPQRIGKSECHPISATLSRFAGIVRSYFRGADWLGPRSNIPIVCLVLDFPYCCEFLL